MSRISSRTDEPPRFLKPAMLTQKVNLSRSQIYRLEEAGKFPARRRFGKRNVSWETKSVLAWMQDPLDARSRLTGIPNARIRPNDRFIGKSQVRELVPLSDRQISRLEADNRFPKRLPLGPKRVAWLEREILDWIATRPVAQTAPSLSKDIPTHD